MNGYLANQIIVELLHKPNQTAKDLAQHIGVSEEQVWSAFYQKLQGMVYCDNDGIWHFSDHISETNRAKQNCDVPIVQNNKVQEKKHVIGKRLVFFMSVFLCLQIIAYAFHYPEYSTQNETLNVQREERQPNGSSAKVDEDRTMVNFKNTSAKTKTANVASTSSENDNVIPHSEGETYIINKTSGKIHSFTCGTAYNAWEGNPDNFMKTDQDLATLISEGFSPCGNCLD